jgi:primosomal protein N' (replication factor Y)
VPPRVEAPPAPFAEVAVPVPLRRTFHYRIPAALAGAIAPGVRVRVPFGARRVIGVVVGLAETTDAPPASVKEIEKALDAEPALPPALLELTRFVADYYRTSWGEALEAALPGSVKRRRRNADAALGDDDDAAALVAPELEEAPTLTAGQERALGAARDLLDARRFGVVLVHGVTGSGKTEVYIRALEHVRALGRTGLLLVPEIALTPQTLERLSRRLGAIGVLHSMQGGRERARQWERARAGDVSVVVGPRSAVFAPLPRLGLIVVDEEHEPSFKQGDPNPRYHARDVAVYRGKREGAAVILGSATPSLETFENARQGRYRGIYLEARATGARLPSVEVVDLRDEARERKDFPFISRRLEALVREALSRKEQAILFLNRRGFSTFIHCKRCGHVLTCGACSVALTFHKARGEACCHYCEKRLAPPRTCPSCLAPEVQYFGFGTERIADEAMRRFPGAVVRRLDSDAIPDEPALRKALDEFRRGEAQILVGTQMVAKGLDFPRVTVVGVINADTALNFPDFRASERTFQILAQVAGRAGRAELAGKTVIQTFSPGHPAVRAAETHDSLGFLEAELAHRKKLDYPPFGRLALLVVSSPAESEAARAAGEIAGHVRAAVEAAGVESGRLRILGPAPAPLSCLRGRHRFMVLLKAKDRAALSPALDAVETRPRLPAAVRVTLDVDPVSML